MVELAFGDCRVIEELGSGSISTVYKATQEPLGRTVAVKALKSTIATTSPFAAHLEREARLLGELCHPNIALLLQFAKTESQMYLVIEYVDGPSLSRLLAKKPKLLPEVVAAIGAGIARGLAHAHERGVVHRDVKPPNVVLSKRGEVKLVDFGIAQRERMPSLDEPLERADESEAFGTPAYMSPEQILGEFVDVRSDLFSLGVVLYQMLAGVRPFDAEDATDRRATAQRIRRDPPKPLRAREPEVPRALERLVMRLLEKLPADRYASASTVADLLDEIVASTSAASSRQLITRALIEAGLAKPAAPAATFELPGPARSGRMASAFAGFGALCVLIVGGAAAIQWNAHDRRGPSRERATGALLAGPSPSAGYLRVSAAPWAEVAIDGVAVDVTPFARSIPLEPGTHYVTLTHPEAAAEKRVVEIAAGATVLVDVTMNVRTDASADAPAASAEPSAAPRPRGARAAAAATVGTARGDALPQAAEARP
jgi:predicted Ser/Thr protein kinase